MSEARAQEAIRRAGSSSARAASALLLAGSGLVALSLALPHPRGADAGALAATAAAMLAAGAAGWFGAPRIPAGGVHAMLAAVAAVTALLIVESGIAVGQYGSIFVWQTLVASYFFPRRIAAAHLAWLLIAYGAALALVQSTGYSPLTRWVFTLVSLGVVMVLTTAIVARRARADDRARRFFDLSRDMLCTATIDGYLIEMNGSWRACLGYTPEELRAVRFMELVHPDDRARSEAELAAILDEAGGVAFECRCRAKDGSWRWLRWSSRLSPDEGLIYARATDVTELKRVEDEREELLLEVQDLARRDALTGVPNRRLLDDRLPQEMARARRGATPLCLAILDIDHFKAYNDAHGHPAGDEVLRACAAAWDSRVRGEDLLVRIGGEEFLVLLPGATLAEAAKVVERLRAATPAEQTCSAGVACWNFVESADDLLGRADNALYAAKEGGRDRLVEAPGGES